MSSSFIGLKLNPINEYNFIQWYEAQNMMLSGGDLNEKVAFPTLSHENQQYFDYKGLPAYWQKRFRLTTYAPVFVHGEPYTFYINNEIAFNTAFMDFANVNIGMVSATGLTVVNFQSSKLVKDDFGNGDYRILVRDFIADAGTKPGFYRLVLFNSVTSQVKYISNVIEVMQADECSYSIILEYACKFDEHFYFYKTGSVTGFVNKLRVHILTKGASYQTEEEYYKAVNTGIGRISAKEPNKKISLETWFFDANAHEAMAAIMSQAPQGTFRINGVNYLPSGDYQPNTIDNYPLTKGSFEAYDQDFATAKRSSAYQAPPAFFLTSRRLLTPVLSLDLDNKSVDEGQPIHTTVGNFVWTNATLPILIELVSGIGDTDNHRFRICPDCMDQELQTNEVFDYFYQKQLSIRAKITDITGNTASAIFLISVNEIGAAITGITLSDNTIDENLPIGTQIGVLSTQGGTAPYAYQIIQNGEFYLEGNILRSNKIYDYEARTSYPVSIRSTDLNGATYAKTFTILIGDIDEGGGYDLTLSENRISENQLPRVIGTLQGVGGTPPYTYSIVSQPMGGSPGGDPLFSAVTGEAITGFARTGYAPGAVELPEFFDIDPPNALVSLVPFNYEEQNEYDIIIRWVDAEGEVFEKAFTIFILDLPESVLSDVALSKNTIDENEPIGTLVGFFQGIGGVPPYTYTLFSGQVNNNDFDTTGAGLYSAISFNYEATQTRTIRVNVEDANFTNISKDFVIQIGNVPEVDNILLDVNHICEDMPSGSLVGNLAGIGGTAPYTFAKVAGTGSTNNASFTVTDSQLLTAIALDYSTKSDYSIRLRVTDADGGQFEKVFVIYIDEVVYVETVTEDTHSYGTDIGTSGAVPADSDISGTATSGASTILSVGFSGEQSPGAWRKSYAWIRFDLSGIDYEDDILDAKFILTRPADNLVSAFNNTDLDILSHPSTFNEDTLNWNNQPLISGASLIGTANAVDGEDEVAFQVTSIIKQRAGTFQTFVIRKRVSEHFPLGNVPTFFEFASKEHATLNVPRIKICRYNPDNPGPEDPVETGFFDDYYDDYFE